MGERGVTCMPLQHIMEKFPASEVCCGGASSNGNGSGKGNTKPGNKSSAVKVSKRIKMSREPCFNSDEPNTTEMGSEEHGRISEEVENGELKEEMEEGELGTLKSPAMEFSSHELTADKSQGGELEKGEIVYDRGGEGGLEKGEILPRKWRKNEHEKSIFNSGRLQGSMLPRKDRTPEKHRKFDTEKTEFGTGKGTGDEIEKGEFIPDRWQKRDFPQNDFNHSKTRRHEFSRERDWRNEREWTPPSGKYLVDNISPAKHGSRHSKRSARWEAPQERSYAKLSSKIVDEGSSLNGEQIRGKNRGAEHSSSSRLKRHGNDPDSSDRKHYDDHVNHASSKSRRLSCESFRSARGEHLSRRSVERSHKDSASRIGPDRHSARRHDSSSRSAHDRYANSPNPSERSSHDRARYTNHRDQTPSRNESSLRDRRSYMDHRNRSPGYAADRSPRDRGRPHGRKDQSPSSLEQLQYRQRRHNREANQKREAGEPRVNHKIEEENLGERDAVTNDTTLPAKDSQREICMLNGSSEKSSNSFHRAADDSSQIPALGLEVKFPHENGSTEELLSMEEDMDICDTPPHVSIAADANVGKWCYLDHLGFERGPSRLCDLKALVEGGALASDHLIKHLDSNRWVTVENAASPVATLSYSSIVSDSVTQLVNPPEAPGNLLAEGGDSEESVDKSCEESKVVKVQPAPCSDHNLDMLGDMPDLKIDERIGSLLGDKTSVHGNELEALGEVLQMKFNDPEWERWANLEGLNWHDYCDVVPTEQSGEELSYSVAPRDAAQSTSVSCFDSDFGYPICDFNEWFSIRWPCKGGDWRRNDDAVQDRSFQKKLVLNDGYPLCQMRNSRYEDPRCSQRDDLYHSSKSRRLDLPPWAFSLTDERNDMNSAGRPGQAKPVLTRGAKGSVLPVVRINACVVKDQGSFVSDSRGRVRSKERHSSKSSRSSSSKDACRASTDRPSRSKSINEHGMDEPVNCDRSVHLPEGRLGMIDELRLDLGHWYYLDGSGHEHGPFSYSELQVSVDKGSIQKYISVYRKTDRVWVPVVPSSDVPQCPVVFSEKRDVSATDSSSASLPQICGGNLDVGYGVSRTFHRLHPQFIGYTRGKLHELVMKTFKSREFAAVINEVLDPWISAKQPKKEMEKHLYPKAAGSEAYSSREDQIRFGKRPRLTFDEYDRDHEMLDSLPSIRDGESSFEDLCGDATFPLKELECLASEGEGWGQLDGHILARIFHFLRTDIKSLVVASCTCRQWRAAAEFYKNVSILVDLSSVGTDCTDHLTTSIMSGYNKEKLKSMVLAGCTNITSGVLEEILHTFSHISSLDIRGCGQFDELVGKYPRINWVRDWTIQLTRRLKQNPERSSYISSHRNDIDDSSGLKDYFDMVEKRDAANQAFRQSLYKRNKVFDTRRSASILSRDAQMRRWTMKKPGNALKKMEEFVLRSLNGIMKDNAIDFFVPKVSEIKDRIKCGYYAVRGLSSIKEDICRMCRDAAKNKSRSDVGDINNIVTEFIRLATHVGGSKRTDADKIIKALQEEYPSTSKFKKYNKVFSERKNMSRFSGSSLSNGASNQVEYSSDREARRRHSFRLNEKSLGSGTSSSDEFEDSSDTESGSRSSNSETESDMDSKSDTASRDFRDGSFVEDEDFDLSTDEREWGARMTKASLVPPVTRKYEVIDEYLVVADEEEVRRKMRVALPDDYDEKVKAQSSGMEEADMEIPEVKEFKPRKQLGDEVIEQEVYGIDPYTHNLLLDSMSKDEGWTLQQKHHFIEDVLLRTLNKHARDLTGSGNTPMTYSLRPVILDILNTAKGQQDLRTQKLCEVVLEAVDSRPDDKYVAYRKGLGVVCYKDGGIEKDDFVVEFLGEVYPAWKWFEKQDGIRSLQRNNKDPAPEFYNIHLERPKGDADGYDLVVVDAMHKANYASRICHSCQPNCEAKVTAVGGHYQIGIYSVRPILFGEEITFDYNSVTESKEEYEASVCLCGSQVCRGSYLNLTGEGAFQKVLKEWHGLLDRHRLMLEACELNWVSEEDYLDLSRAGLGSCLLGGLPDWLIAYSARLVRFINFERTKLPQEILKHNLEEKSKYFTDVCIEDEKSDAEIQAEGVYNQRLQNLALTLDKVRYVMRRVFGDPKEAPPPLQKLSSEEKVSYLWKGDGSLVEELLRCIGPHVEDGMLKDLKLKIRAHDPSASDDLERELRRSLLWLRDEVRNLPCAVKCRHDAAADLIHVYAYTKCFFKIEEYKTVTSPPVLISPLDLGPKCADKLSGLTEYCKTYNENYCLGQLIYWQNQTSADPDRTLGRLGRGCLALPDIGSFYARAQKASRQRVYGPRTLRFMLNRMEKQPQRPWPKDRIWEFKDFPKIIGSPMLDAVLNNCPLEREMVTWLKNRPAIFHALSDR